ncbi:UxaA family hydrolase [Parachryseolinea silvisoli]|uniref:UxaA family hydrolase n=1 Tax=Parachryseolinea silvisoli TaxID=2873601 RepID=UPI002265F3DE|nr:altronate dehydratase family protein [Parachryseolinea silvisoli]MCD9014626.1 altronate dehydratase family protein [Parachryseolinea silvisoli]
MSNRFLKIHPADNVYVALTDLKAGETLTVDGGKPLTLVDDVPAKHKFTEAPLQPDDEVLMYGTLVGKAVQPIRQGGVIGTHNLKHKAAPYAGRTKAYSWAPPDVSAFKDKTFMGYHRADGQVGTANYWLIVPLVFCENRNVEVITEAFTTELGFGKPEAYKDYVHELVQAYRNGGTTKLETVPFHPAGAAADNRLFKNIDGVKFLTHQGGCGGTRQDSQTLCKLLAGYIHHPNVAGATVLSLGCQNAEITTLQERLKELDPKGSKPVFILDQQQSGTEQELLTQAIRQTFAALVEANKIERKPAPLSKLVVGLKCGGSDGFSGISANPAIGHTSDLLVTLGGSTILSEFPELCGVEQELINRCEEDAAGELFIKLMRTYSNAAEAVGSGFDMNPSPGNIKDGLITDAIKSAGAAKKGGTAPVADVLQYAEYIKKPGLNLLCTPGNDVESTTGTTGSGAQIILFTTGLGTPTGNPVSQVVKLSTNTKLAERMPDIIDFNTGSIISGEKTIDKVGEEILDFIIEVASGRVTAKSVALGQDDFIPWKRGVSL